MPILAFRLFGPLSAWGTSEAGEEVRPTARHPSRSAVLGLVAAASGLTRDDDEGHRQLAEGYALAVAAYGRRQLLRDYRTVQTVEPIRAQRKRGFSSRREALAQGTVHTMVSRRDYLQDGLWTVFLWPRSGAADDARKLETALRQPCFDLYLGRRCCPPALPLGPKVLDVVGLDKALVSYPPIPEALTARNDDNSRAGRALRILRGGLGQLVDANGGIADLCWDDDFPGTPGPGNWRLVRDEPSSRSRRLFTVRREAFLTLRRGDPEDAE